MYSNLDRPPLQPRALNRGLVPPWREVRVLDEIGSTNDYVAALARQGAREGLVVVAEHQFLGRGRLDRTWTSPPRAGLTLSMLFRPPVAPSVRPWLPLLVAACAADAVSSRCDLDVALKWPNDLLVDGRKLAGVLAETTGDAVVVGIGLNVHTTRDELPRDDATSLALESARPVDRMPLLLALLRTVGPAYAGWLAGEVDARERYLARCDTLGRAVRVQLPGGTTLAGEATDVDESGRLVVTNADGATAVSAGDVVHVRPDGYDTV